MLRELALSGLEWAGISVDRAANDATVRGRAGEVQAPGSRVKVSALTLPGGSATRCAFSGGVAASYGWSTARGRPGSCPLPASTASSWRSLPLLGGLPPAHVDLRSTTTPRRCWSSPQMSSWRSRSRRCGWCGATPASWRVPPDGSCSPPRLRLLCGAQTCIIPLARSGKCNVKRACSR